MWSVVPFTMCPLDTKLLRGLFSYDISVRVTIMTPVGLPVWLLEEWELCLPTLLQGGSLSLCLKKNYNWQAPPPFILLPLRPLPFLNPLSQMPSHPSSHPPLFYLPLTLSLFSVPPDPTACMDAACSEPIVPELLGINDTRVECTYALRSMASDTSISH